MDLGGEKVASSDVLQTRGFPSRSVAKWLERSRVAAAVAAAMVVGASVRAEEVRWGSDLQFNPASMILNEGWDITQLEGRDNRLGTLNGARAFGLLGRTMSHPVASIRKQGVGDFASSELLPLSLRAEKAQWIPNYQLHLVGGGLLNWKAEEWYRERGYGSPRLMAFATSAASWILNETSEIATRESEFSTDPVADLMFFDLAGVLVFQSSAVRGFFRNRVEAMNWPLQPSLDPSDGRITNAGQYHALKIPLPRTDDWKIFYHMGLGNIAGLSRRIGSGHSISIGAGAYARRIVRIDSTRNSAALSPKLGVFWDRDNSLWMSAFLNSQSVQRFLVQVYPTPMTSWPVPWGFWASCGEEGTLGFGLTASLGIGIGASR